MPRFLDRLRPHGLRNSVIAIVAVAFLLLTAAQYLVTGRFVEKQLLDIESEDGFERLTSLHHALGQLEDDLQATTSDWSQWDTTYQFAQGRHPTFVEDNLDAQTLQRLRLEFLVIVDRGGRVLFARGPSQDGTQFIEAPADLTAQLVATVLDPDVDPMSVQTGLMVAGDRSYLISSQPILMSVAELPPAGRLLMSRSLERFVVPSLQRVTGETLSLEPVSEHLDHGDQLLRERDDDVLLLHKGELSGFSPLRDLQGTRIAQLHMSMSRPTQAMLAEARRYLLSVTLVLGAVFCGIAVWLLRANLIGPIERLAAAVGRVGHTSGAEMRVPVVKAVSEFETLTRAINEMLEQIEQQQVMRRDRDAAMEANRLKSEFLATMSHEIRTPMNGVLGMCELLQRTSLDPRQQHFADTILRSARSLLGILNDVLDFSKIEAGRLELELAPYSPTEVLHGVSAPFIAAAQEKGLDFSVKIEAGVAPLVVGDALRLRQILNNLLSNAIKFTASGSVSVTCSASATGGNGTRLKFTVADTGIGIAPAVHEHIFDPFTQAATDTSRRFGGTGLGLAIVRRLVGLMGGEIELSSTPGRGSKFVFTILAERVVELPSRIGLSEATGGRFATSYAPSVLLAEDNAVNREVFTEMLEHLGCRVTAVENGAMAVAAVADRGFDAILMDCQMPVMDGHAATAELRALEREAAQKRAFIIALTADATPENQRRCLDAGMDAVVTKPISHSGLREVLLRALAPA